MKKDESPTVRSLRGSLRNDNRIPGQRIQPMKPFLGCDTCKMKNNPQMVKKSKPSSSDVSGKTRKMVTIDSSQTLSKKPKVKLTDLCEEDKKRIVELMEELSKFAEKNRTLKEALEMSERGKQEQQECLMKQTNLHLEEKNIFLKEIQTYKAKLEVYETEMKEKMAQWESRERFMDNEIRYLAKALQKSFSEKTELKKEVCHLKTCLKQSLESFELLRNEVTTLQRLSAKPGTTGSNFCLAATVAAAAGGENREQNSCHRDESEEEVHLITKSYDTQANKNSLDVINKKLEQLYALLQNRSGGGERMESSSASRSAARLVVEESKTKTDSTATDGTATNQISDANKKSQSAHTPSGTQPDEGDTTAPPNKSSYKFLKPFNEYNKTSVQAERILKKMEEPFSFELSDRFGSERSGSRDEESQLPLRPSPQERRVSHSATRSSGVLDHVIDDHLHEDRLLHDLFYTDAILDLGLESALLWAAQESSSRPNVNSRN